ncbi:hypothetical protein ACLOJK_032385 [Asimina triloba]
MDAQSRCSYRMQAVVESENEEEEPWSLQIKIILTERSRVLRESPDGFIIKVEDESAPENIEMFDDAFRLYAQLDRSKRRVRTMMSHLQLHLVGNEFLTERLASSATFLTDLAMKSKCAVAAIIVEVDVVTSLLVRDGKGSPVKGLRGKAAGLDEETQSNASCAVCFEELWGAAVAASLPCCHRFHRECIMNWFSERQTCPLCRLEIPIQHNLQGSC